LKDLIAAILFVAALAATLTLLMGQGAVGALASSGLILAVLGFAVRNVVADTLSGIAIGMEGPFRIGDWVEINGLARGRVIEIGWRTTRILTRDATYMIVPNSQIALQRITNYSAPKPQYRAQLSVTLDKRIPIQEASEVMLGALRTAKLIQQDPAPDIRILAYSEDGITYAARYWLARFDRDVDCRDEVYRSIDDALRRARMISPCGQIERADSDRSADTPSILDTSNTRR
jgi:small-conductance mechanosensitive channel